MTSTQDNINPQLQHLVDDRSAKLKVRDEAAAQVQKLNDQIMDLMLQTGQKRHQLFSGTVISIVSPPERTTIVRERLLALGISPKVIADASQSSPVKAFIRVDAPKATGQPTIADRIADRTMDPTHAADADPSDVTH